MPKGQEVVVRVFTKLLWAVGFYLVPLLGGLVAEHFNARLPYLMGSMVILVTIGIQLLIHKMNAPLEDEFEKAF